MIKNDWQFRVTQRWIKDFENALFELKRLPASKAQPWLRAAQQESLESELTILRNQIDDYELLKAHKVALPGPEAIRQIPELLIKTRISQGLTQEELATMLGVTKQCIQQYEKTNYAHVTISTAERIMQALSVPGVDQSGVTGAKVPKVNQTTPASRSASKRAIVSRAKEGSSAKKATPKKRTKGA
ncbi:MAG: helix-turn-helix transcriptional regulator [Candidatus Melainabacteria bacterium]|nr:helix-turn-helix transcriptional regulator [Candidatus Melainabacteria bacterium]